MIVILVGLGLLQMLGGLIVAATAKSAIHEILGAISFGMGTLAIGLSAVISRLDEVKAATERRSEEPASASEAPKWQIS